MNTAIVAFEKSLHTIMTTDEIDKVINHATWREKRWLKYFKNWYRENVKDWDVPIWASLPSIQSARLFADVIRYMVSATDTVYHGENEEGDADEDKPKTAKKSKKQV